MARIYIAAPFELIGEANMIKLLLECKGFTVTSRWLDESASETFDKMTDHERRTFCAGRDMEDILTSEGLLLLNPPAWAKQGSGGRHFETAVSYMANLPVFVYGVETNVFHAMPGIVVKSDIKELIGAMRFKFGIDEAAPLVPSDRQSAYVTTRVFKTDRDWVGTRRMWLAAHAGPGHQVEVSRTLGPIGDVRCSCGDILAVYDSRESL